MALPYIKLEDMTPEFHTACKNFQKFINKLTDPFKIKITKIIERTNKFLSYILKYWLKDDDALAEFNCFENYNRTNNPLESFHKQLNKGIERNPDAKKFVSK